MVTRKEILNMLAAGQIDVTRATELLSQAREQGAPDPVTPPEAAVPPTPAAPQPAMPLPPRPPADDLSPRWLRIQVSQLSTGRHRVKVNIPLSLVEFGMKIGARFTDELDANMVEGVMQALEQGTTAGTLVEVEDIEDDERVLIFVE